MAVEVVNPELAYRCLSTDTKPTNPSYDLLYETDSGIWYVYNGSAWVVYNAPPQAGSAQARTQFLAQLEAITGGGIEAILLARPTDTTTSLDASVNGLTINHKNTVAGRLSPLGFGHGISMSGVSSTDFAYISDNDLFSPGNGSADSAFSVVALIDPTSEATVRVIAGKWSTVNTTREWKFDLTTTNGLRVRLYDESADAAVDRITDGAITHGVPFLMGFSYTASTGGENAPNDISIYKDGLVEASTPTPNASYAAMENLNQILLFGADGNAGSAQTVFDGSYYFAVYVSKALTADQHWAIRRACEGYFNFLA